MLSSPAPPTTEAPETLALKTITSAPAPVMTRVEVTSDTEANRSTVSFRHHQGLWSSIHISRSTDQVSTSTTVDVAVKKLDVSKVRRVVAMHHPRWWNRCARDCKCSGAPSPPMEEEVTLLPNMKVSLEAPPISVELLDVASASERFASAPRSNVNLRVASEYQGVSTSCTINSGASNHTQIDAVCTTSGVSRSISVDRDVVTVSALMRSTPAPA